MPRLLKEGLDYFTLDCDFYDNKKIRLFRAEFLPEQRLSVTMVLVLLLSRIYSGKGYYITWDEAEQSLFCEDVGISSEYCDAIIEAALKHRIFDRDRYDGVGVLTSAETLKRYVSATIKRKRRSITPEIALMTEETAFLAEEMTLRENLSVPKCTKERNVTERNVTELERSQNSVINGLNGADKNWPPDSTEFRTWQTFESEYNDLIPNPQKQMDAVNKLIGEARARGDPAAILPGMIATLKRLKDEDNSKKGFWRKQPFLPSTLVSLWAQVWEEAKQESGKEWTEADLEDGEEVIF